MPVGRPLVFASNTVQEMAAVILLVFAWISLGRLPSPSRNVIQHRTTNKRVGVLDQLACRISEVLVCSAIGCRLFELFHSDGRKVVVDRTIKNHWNWMRKLSGPVCPTRYCWQSSGLGAVGCKMVFGLASFAAACGKALGLADDPVCWFDRVVGDCPFCTVMFRLWCVGCKIVLGVTSFAAACGKALGIAENPVLLV